MKAFLCGLFALVSTFGFCQKSSSEAASKAITKTLDSIAKTGFFNGFSVAISDEKGTLYSHGFGFSDVSSGTLYTEKTIQNIGSVSKTLVGLAIMKAVDLGKLKLDDDVNKYLPFKVVNPKFPAVPITVRMLANHTSSIVDSDAYLSKNYYLKPDQNHEGLPLEFEDQKFIGYDEALSLENYLKAVLTPDGKYFEENTFAGKPGEFYGYSNTGTALAAYVTALAVKIPFATFCEKHILKPLKMNASGWDFSMVDFKNYSRLYADPKTALPFYALTTYPDGNFITSSNDMSKYLTELINGYTGKGKILSRESYAEYFRPQLQASNFKERNEKNPYNESYNVGIFMGFGYTGMVGHTGGDPGVSSLMFIDPKTKIGRYMVVNTNFSDKDGMKAFFAIWAVLEKWQGLLREK